jgi:hypothetical protein
MTFTDSDEILVCIHCNNPVVEIDYGEKVKHLAHGELENKYKHGHPRPFTVCSVNPIMDEDVHWISRKEFVES